MQGEDTAVLEYTLAVTKSYASLKGRFSLKTGEDAEIMHSYVKLVDRSMELLDGKELARQLAVLRCQRDLLLMAAHDAAGARLLDEGFDVAGLQSALNKRKLTVRQACVEWAAAELGKGLEGVINVSALRKAVADRALIRNLEMVNDDIRDLLNAEEKHNGKTNKRGVMVDPLAARGVLSAA